MKDLSKGFKEGCYEEETNKEPPRKMLTKLKGLIRKNKKETGRDKFYEINRGF